uniref:Nuclease associated modular domain-containing protein n=1 Tax=Aegilops tauschii subsp. strangulata TaxID=200361 RepID=A0A452YA64_AEGTS
MLRGEETKIKISLGVRRGWSLRLQKLMVQDGCFVEWREMIADAARKGFAGGVAFQWNSHKILTEQLRQEWLEKVQQRRSMPRPTGNRRAPKTPEQRRKIAEAIAAKWLDREYRERVCSAINSYHGTSSGSKVPRKQRTPREPGEKLEMITKIRAQRTALEIEKKEAIERARSLIVEAEKAANALEPVAAKIPFAQASLIEARKLVTEARMSLEGVDDNDGPAESSSDDTLDDSGVSELHKLENQNDPIKQENKSVNGMKLPPRTVNGMDFYFDVSALGEKEQLSMFQRIENSMERAYLLPSAFSTAQDVNGNLGTNDLYISEQVVNNDQIDRIAADTTEFISAEPLENVSSPANKSKMRWVRGRLVEGEE